MEPLTCKAGHIEGSDGDALIIGDLMKLEVVVDLEQPSKDIIAGEEWNLQLWQARSRNGGCGMD